MKGTVIEKKLISIREGLMERSGGGWRLARPESYKTGLGSLGIPGRSPRGHTASYEPDQGLEKIV